MKNNLLKNLFLGFFLILNFIVILINLRLFKSSKEQVMLHVDFNNFQSELKTPIDLVETFIDDFPNLNATLIPIKIAKANYFIQEKDYKKAEKLRAPIKPISEVR